MKGKKSFIFYCDWKDTFDQLPSDKAGDLIKHLLAYVNDENPETDDVLINAVFANIKNALKRDLKGWEERADRSRENGKKGGRPPNNDNPEKPSGLNNNPDEPEKPDSVNASVSVNAIKEKFVLFWDLYNKKVSRSSCERIWNKLKESDRDAILYTLPSFLETITDKQYQPHPKTYLNQRRWEDVIDKSDGKPPQMKQENWDKLDSWQQESIRAGIAL